jgi:hypothetical protein
VIPCLAPEADFFFDPELRARVRADLGMVADETVYIYSGSLAAYQCFDETIAAFGAVLASGVPARLIVLTPDVERAVKKASGVPADRVICKAVPHRDVNGYLNAADVGMLLRDSTPVNAVAFPTKFAEYAMTGLKVMMKDMPPACVDAARELGNFLPLGASGAAWSLGDRARCAAQTAQRLGRHAALPTYAAVYEQLAGGRAQDLKAVR